jgi:Ca-activated chloride channel homolog
MEDIVTPILLTGSPRHQTKTLIDIAVAVFLAGLFLLAGFFSSAQAGVVPNDMTSGSLLLKLKDGSYVEAPRLGSDYSVSVSGPTARTILTQRFSNPSDGWVEGVYVFPLPEESAVDTLRIVAGNRVIVGEVKERQEAKAIYEAAKRDGQTAALLEQERPNIFTNSVANIGPHDAVVVQIEYQETVKQSDGTFTLRLPLVVAPRYNPAPIQQTVDFKPDDSGYGAAKNDPVPDRDRITPPVLNPATHALINPVSITVNVRAGFDIANIKSAYHNIDEATANAQDVTVKLADSTIPADKDFELTWQAKGTAPQVGLFHESIGGKDYLLATITPPTVPGTSPVLPRESVFVIDNSGSMDGPSMEQAKAALLLGLDKLTAKDTFNVIRFDDTMDVLFPTAVAANKENLDAARRFVSALTANGGTEMIPPLKAALQDDHVNDASRLRQIVFITDGAIGNEQEMFALLTKNRGRSRVFMVGIGSAPNSYLMTRAAELGRGTFTFIGDASQVQARMDQLFTKIGQPVITALVAEIAGSSVKLTPNPLPDLYRGEPVLVMAEGSNVTGTLVVSGKIGDAPWSAKLPLAGAAQGKGISKLWAHRKIADIEVESTLGSITPDVANKQVLTVALAHQIVSSQTSLIAVDKTPKRPADQALTRAEVPLNLPAGWSFDKVFGKDMPTEPDLKHERDASLKAYTQLASLEKPVTQVSGLQQTVDLPQTATDAELLALLGAMLAAMAMALRMMSRRVSVA